MNQELFTLPQAAEILSQPYHRIYYSLLTGTVSPLKVGRTRLLSVADLEGLRKHFSKLDSNKNKKNH